MVVVGAGSSARFGGDKLMTPVAGRPLLAHTVAAVAPLVDHCVLVCRPDQQTALNRLELGVTIVPGGATRTASEMAGLAAVGGHRLIGVHDGARPVVTPQLVEALFAAADQLGGAVPLLEPAGLIVEREPLSPLHSAGMAQTPQVFRGAELLAAFEAAEREGYDGHDTVEVVHRFSMLEVAAVPGDPGNVKVTYPEDLDLVRAMLAGPSRS